MASGVQPLVLLANADKWLAESLESVLTQGGFLVTTTEKRQTTVELARRHRPDAILLDLALDRRSTDSFALCRALRAEPGEVRDRFEAHMGLMALDLLHALGGRAFAIGGRRRFRCTAPRVHARFV